eukprot:CAMPEP_0172451628 /NCGR_PEP_ID=MMETSP1065-20121228/9594_1 /TAXON_ID=265537 /ORGANISM="Amphiprora paludosa, Strain CCMP125" /LENGTH=456 /DNA_ID=CAMNT_0013203591 /DNA_START=1 /DNA_END=1371 /DNA_ORIENTATION=-
MGATAFSSLKNGSRPWGSQQQQQQQRLHRPSSLTKQWVHLDREADMYEEMMGGQRYEMSPLPDSMMPTTLFVGNLCEFVGDDDLSQLFCSVTSLKSLPACIVRKPDSTSKRYGFVSFPTVQEKEAALLRFDGYEYKGRSMKVECIKDHPTGGRVLLPESMIHYVLGAVKPTPRTNNKEKKNKIHSLRRISRDDVERLSRGQPAKKKGYGSRSVPHRLNDLERQEMTRAQTKGFVTVVGGGNRRTRKGSPLKNIHRQWCDARGKPQIVLYKTTTGSEQGPLDMVEVDLAPVRLLGSITDLDELQVALAEYKRAVETAATKAGMSQSMNVEQEMSDSVELEEEEEESEVSDLLDDMIHLDATQLQKLQESWATKPIWKLPPMYAVNAVFWGQRSQAKVMAKELAVLWDLPEESRVPTDDDTRNSSSRRSAGAKRGGRTKMRGLSQHRKRGGGHRQSFY